MYSLTAEPSGWTVSPPIWCAGRQSSPSITDAVNDARGASVRSRLSSSDHEVGAATYGVAWTLVISPAASVSRDTR